MNIRIESYHLHESKNNSIWSPVIVNHLLFPNDYKRGPYHRASRICVGTANINNANANASVAILKRHYSVCAAPRTQHHVLVHSQKVSKNSHSIARTTTIHDVSIVWYYYQPFTAPTQVTQPTQSNTAPPSWKNIVGFWLGKGQWRVIL